jgi:hypothetical protein
MIYNEHLYKIILQKIIIIVNRFKAFCFFLCFLCVILVFSIDFIL